MSKSLCLLLLLQAFCLYAQPQAKKLAFAQIHQPDSLLHTQHQTVMFWNIENAFWPADDPTRQDDDYTPSGSRHWTLARLKHKLTQIERGLLGAGKGLAPMVVGLAEVEGDSVMQYWLRKTPLRRLGYRYVAAPESDRRGITTALLYQPFDFRLLHSRAYSIQLPSSARTTRQLLHVAGRLVNADTLDLIVCHLPSQYGGTRQSQDSRQAAQRQLMHLADSIADARLTPHVIIMGDMNLAPSSRQRWWNTRPTERWQNLMLPLQQALERHPGRMGSHKYQGEWSFLDQFIVFSPTASAQTSASAQSSVAAQSSASAQSSVPAQSPAPAQSSAPTDSSTLAKSPISDVPAPSSAPASTSSHVRYHSARVFTMPFMLADDFTQLGQRPKRSFFGGKYEAGCSDHLPIVLDLEVDF